MPTLKRTFLGAGAAAAEEDCFDLDAAAGSGMAKKMDGGWYTSNLSGQLNCYTLIEPRPSVWQRELMALSSLFIKIEFQKVLNGQAN